MDLQELIYTVTVTKAFFVGNGYYSLLDPQRLQLSPSSACVQYALRLSKRRVCGDAGRISLGIGYQRKYMRAYDQGAKWLEILGNILLNVSCS